VTSLFELLPAVHRLRDAAIAGTIPAEQGPLEAFLAAVAEQVDVLEESIDQLYDDQFIETCAPWVEPYIGDLIGYRPLHGRAPGLGSRRAEVAHTIALRRRKGTASVLEQLARDVTGWDARVVEFFELLATTQYMNHRRLGNRVTPSLRDAAAMDAIGTAFDAVPRTLDVRRIARGRGRHNVPNIGVFLWRIGAYRLERSPAAPSAAGPAGRSFRFSPLGADGALYTRPEAEDEITHLAEPINVPAPIDRGTLARNLELYYGPGRSIEVHFDEGTEPASRIAVCDLRDHGAGWAHDAPAGKVAIDPELGRLVVAADLPAPTALHVTHHYGAAGSLGGGAYPRDDSFESPSGELVRVPADHPTIQAALDSLGGAGVVEIIDNGRYAETLAVDVSADRAIELRAAPGRRPTLELGGPFNVRGGDGGAFALNGLLVAGNGLIVPVTTGLRRLRIAHCTLVPGRNLGEDGLATDVGQPSVQLRPPGARLEVERSITGPLRVSDSANAAVTDAIVDASTLNRYAYGSTQGGTAEPGGALALEAVTVIGRLACQSLTASNSLLLGAVRVVRRQEGCVRFSFVAPGSATPRRYRCATADFPRLASLRYGTPAYCQLTERTPDAIRRGADDESEMGAFHFLYAPQRESDLRTRLDEYLRVGLEAGIFYES
jgi:hypothetical protein